MVTITKIITIQDDSELKEMTESFGNFCVVSDAEIAKKMQTFTSSLRLVEYIDYKQKQGLIIDIEEPLDSRQIDFIIDLSSDAKKASFELFGKR